MLNLFQHPCEPIAIQGLPKQDHPMEPCVYILAGQRRGTLYIGVTSDLRRRIHEHRAGIRSGFASRYGVMRLVLIEAFPDMASAIAREKQLKRWHRDWKIAHIEASNPGWRDLAIDLGFLPLTSRNAAPDRMDPETSSG
jgi:putative endonuclease